MPAPSYDLPETRDTHRFTEAARFGRHNIVSGYIHSEDWDGDEEGDGSTTGWYVGGDGATVVFNEGEFRGAITAGTIDIGGSDASSFHVDSTGNVWMGAADYTSSPFRIDAAGNLDVGGNDATSLHMDTTGRLWVGDPVFSSAPFKVGNVGGLTATDATITGTIKTAGSGQRVEISSTDANKIYFYTGDADENLAGRVYADIFGSGGARWGAVFIQAPTIRDAGDGGHAPFISLNDESYDNTQASQIQLICDPESAVWTGIAMTAGGDIAMQAPGGAIVTGDEMQVGSLEIGGDNVSFGANDSGGVGFKVLRVPN